MGLNIYTTPCNGPSIDAIEAGIRAYNNPSYYISYSPPTTAPDTWSSWYPGTYYGNQGVTGTYLAMFVDLSGPNGTDHGAYGIGAGGCTTANYFVAVPPRPAPSVADNGKSCPFCKNGTDPINPSSGNEFLKETDIPAIGTEHPLSFERYYNSLDTTTRDQGPAWWHSFSRHLTFGMSYPGTQPPSPQDSSLYLHPADACTSGWTQIQSKVPGLQDSTASYSNGVCSLSLNGSTVMTLPVYDNRGQYITVDSAISSVSVVNAYRDDGHVIGFSVSGSGFTADPGTEYQLVTTTNGGYQLTDEQDNVEMYDNTGRLLSVADRAGNTQTLTYNPSTGLLSSVSDNVGHTLTFAYDDLDRLTGVSAPSSSSTQYAYNTAGDLSQVTNIDGTTRQYEYSDPNWPTGISSVVDENGQTVFSLSYDSQGRAVSSSLAGVSSSMSFSYNSDGSATETDPLGAERTFQFQEVGDYEFSTGVTGAPCFKCGYVASASYDGGGFPASETDFNGNVTTYVHNDARGLETSRTEASGTTVARTITTQWSPTYRLPTLISEYAGGTASGNPIRTTSFGYDGSGNLLSKAITDPTTGTTRTWSYTSDSNGRMLTATDPRQNVTTYTHYTCTTGSQCGQLETATDALGHITTYNTYNSDGHPLTITDPNGVVTTLTYDSRDRLTSRTDGGETTSFSYYPTGLLEQVTLPDSSSISYAYDAAHRLTQVSDGVGNKTVYALDAMANRTAENTYDPSGTLHRTHTRVINTLNEVYQEVNAAGTSAVTTTFGYDNDGNPTSIDAPLSRNTAESYDGLNRVSSITDPGNGLSSFGYDTEDDLTSVTDPRSLTTSYGYDGFGDLTSEVSPDTGTASNTYDPAGNLATSTDARGAVATYGYDALNRVSSIAYSQNGVSDQTLSFTYDQGTDGIGHLTGASDADHSMSFSYDSLGEMTGTSQTVDGVIRSTSYGYTNGDLTSITTPSGQTVTYAYNANHQIANIAVNGTTVLANVSYEPFGPADGWTWGNGSTFSRSFNGDGLIAGISSPESQEGLSYDNASRISGITNTASGSSNWTYGYDELDRLTSATSNSIAEGWTYDTDGNHLSETGSTPSTYAISSTSSEITGITGSLSRTYAYDGAGNTLSDSIDTDTYNDAGRLKTITNASGTATFVYNALGQMIETSSGSGTTLYSHDQAGHLLGEYDGSGNLIQETVWLRDIPVATIQPSGSSVAINYVVTDQLDTPREVIRPSDNARMWTWFTGPFGTEAPNTDPQGAGTVTYDLRFPGQIAGAWGSTYQNYFRDYDPAVGRYVESDPLGLRGGINTYAYAYSDPLIWSDPQGTHPPGSAGPGIETPWPWPIPPIVIPGTPENNAWVQSAYQQIGDAINTIEQACTKEPDCVRASAFHLANAGITDPEEFKKEWVGNAGGRYDICACKDGSISLAAVGQCGRPGPKISTGLTWKK
jgi:RHS repeat-associated protein